MSLADELAAALQPLQAAFDTPGALRDFLEDLGWDFDVAPAAVEALRTPVEQLFALVGAPDGVDALDVVQVIAAARAVFQAIGGLGADPGLAVDFRSEFPRQLADYLVVEYLLNKQPRIGYPLMALGIVSLEERPAAPPRPAYLFRGFAWEGLSELLHDPVSFLRSVYRWGHGDFAGDRLIESLAGALGAWGLKVRPDLLDTPAAATLNSGALQPGATTDAAFGVVLVEHAQNAALLNAGTGLFLLPETASAKPGFALLPYASAGLDEEFPLSDELSLAVGGTLNLAGGAGILVRPGRGVELLLGLSSGAPAPASGALSFAFRLRRAGAPFTPVGSPEGSRFQLAGLATTAGVRLSTGGALDAFVEFALEQGKVLIKPDAATLDGFLADVLPADGIQLEADVTIGVSTENGIYVAGPAGQPLQSALAAHADLDATVPVNRSFGPVAVPSAHLRLTAGRPVWPARCRSACAWAWGR